MGTIYNADPSELIENAAEELKKLESIKAPDWATFVKTGMHKERPPVNKDWWYVRAASILRQIYQHGAIGVSKLRVKYGGKKNCGVKPEHTYKGSGNIIRKILQQLEKQGFVKIDLKSVHKGRLITAKGKKFLDDIAAKILNVPVKKAEEVKPEAVKKEEKKTEQKDAKGKEEIAKKEIKQEQKEKPAKEAIQKEAKPVSQKSKISGNLENSKNFQSKKEAPIDDSDKK